MKTAGQHLMKSSLVEHDLLMAARWRGGEDLRGWQLGEERTDLPWCWEGGVILFRHTWEATSSTATVTVVAVTTTTTKNTTRRAPISGLLKLLYRRNKASFPTRSGASAGARREGASGGEIRQRRWGLERINEEGGGKVGNSITESLLHARAFV